MKNQYDNAYTGLVSRKTHAEMRGFAYLADGTTQLTATLAVDSKKLVITNGYDEVVASSTLKAEKSTGARSPVARGVLEMDDGKRVSIVVFKNFKTDGEAVLCWAADRPLMSEDARMAF